MKFKIISFCVVLVLNKVLLSFCVIKCRLKIDTCDNNESYLPEIGNTVEGYEFNLD